MTECDTQEGQNGPLAHCVASYLHRRSAQLSRLSAAAADPVGRADLRQTCRATRTPFAASIYSPKRCKHQLLSRHGRRMHALQLTTGLHSTAHPNQGCHSIRIRGDQYRSRAHSSTSRAQWTGLSVIHAIHAWSVVCASRRAVAADTCTATANLLIPLADADSLRPVVQGFYSQLLGGFSQSESDTVESAAVDSSSMQDSLL